MTFVSKLGQPCPLGTDGRKFGGNKEAIECHQEDNDSEDEG